MADGVAEYVAGQRPALLRFATVLTCRTWLAEDERAERDEMIRRLAGLPRKQRAAVVLRYYAGMSDTEIAEHLDCRVPTVRSQISRALAALRIDLTTSPRAYQETHDRPAYPDRRLRRATRQYTKDPGGHRSIDR